MAAHSRLGGLLTVVVGAVVGFTASRFQREAVAEAAGYSAGVLFFIAWLFWEDRNKRWFWAFMASLVVIHGTALLTVPWPSHHYMNKGDMLFGLLDFFLAWGAGTAVRRMASPVAGTTNQPVETVRSALDVDATPDVGANRGGKLFLQCLIWIMCGSVLVMFALKWTDQSTELAPNHDSTILTIALAAALATIPIVLALLLLLKTPLRRPRFIAAPIVALAVGAIVGLLTLFTVGRSWQMVDFSGTSIKTQRQFVIWRAYVSHGEVASYHIQLSPYFADLDLSQADYAKAFGTSEEVRPSGYCLQAPTEQNGKSLRIMYSSTRPIPSGRVVRCTQAAGDSGRTFEQVIADCDPKIGIQPQSHIPAAPTPKSGAHRVTNPTWLQKPEGDDISKFYPPEALRANVRGRTSVECVVGADGWTHDCSVKEEAPKGYGFGAAALRLMASRRLIPRRLDCVPTDGGLMPVTIVFAE